MKIAQVTEFGQPPKCVEVEDPPVPSADSGLVQVKFLAAGVHNLVRSRAAGKHYSAQGLPHIPGTDGVGKTPDGQLVYYTAMSPKGGSIQELINVPKAALTPVPAGLDPERVAVDFNPAMSSWMALTTRVENLPKNFSVLILGATTTSGAIAISLARILGAGKIIGCARNAAKMADLSLDETITLSDSVTSTDFSKAADVDVVLDYLYGEPAKHLLNSVKPTKQLQYIQVGSVSGLQMDLSSALLRSMNLVLRGTGPGAWSMGQLKEQAPRIMEALKDTKPTKYSEVKLADIEGAWDRKGERLVIVPS